MNPLRAKAVREKNDKYNNHYNITNNDKVIREILPGFTEIGFPGCFHVGFPACCMLPLDL